MNVEELEKEIQKLKEQRNKYNSLAGAHSWRVEELEKEIQELKAKLAKAVDIIKEYNEIDLGYKASYVKLSSPLFEFREKCRDFLKELEGVINEIDTSGRSFKN